jgi:hypothetical protein
LKYYILFEKIEIFVYNSLFITFPREIIWKLIKRNKKKKRQLWTEGDLIVLYQGYTHWKKHEIKINIDQ